MRESLFARGLVAVTVIAVAWGLGIAQTKITSLSDLGWMAGNWGMSNDRVTIEERWTAPAGSMMLGVERTISHKKNKVVEFEFLRIEERTDGIYYVAQPNGQAPTDFKLVHGSASEAVFQNRSHDFPKRITYRKNADGSITASVDDGADPPKKKEEFKYKRFD
jgi:uncharacterized protein DUF6265